MKETKKMKVKVKIIRGPHDMHYEIIHLIMLVKDSAIHDDELLDSEWQVQDIQACGVLVNF